MPRFMGKNTSPNSLGYSVASFSSVGMQRGGWRGVTCVAGASVDVSAVVLAASAGAALAGRGRVGWLAKFGVPRPSGLRLACGLPASGEGVEAAGVSAAVLSAARAVCKSVMWVFYVAKFCARVVDVICKCNTIKVLLIVWSINGACRHCKRADHHS